MIDDRLLSDIATQVVNAFAFFDDRHKVSWRNRAAGGIEATGQRFVADNSPASCIDNWLIPHRQVSTIWCHPVAGNRSVEPQLDAASPVEPGD